MNPPSDNSAFTPLRKRAEAAFQKATARAGAKVAALSPEETERTLHELRVHQIELEMQNDELRQTQVALAASQAHYFDFYDLAPVGYVSVSETGLILQANLTIATLLELPRAELIKQPLSRFILPTDQDTYYLWRKQLVAPSEPLTCELRLVKSDGTAFWAQLAAIVAQGSGGRPVLRVVLSDISAQKQAEEALQESEERYHTLIDRSPEAITVIRQGKVVFANPAALKLFGATAEDEVKDKPVLPFVHPDFQGAVPALAESITSGGEAQTVEMKLVTLRGTAVDVEVQGTSIVYDGAPALQLSARDITARKQVEAAWRASEERFHAIACNTPDHLIVQDRELRYTFVLHPQLGLTEQEMLGKTDYELLAQDDANRLTVLKRTVLASGQPIHVEVPLRSKGGALEYFNGTYIARTGPDGKPDGVLGYFRNVTAQKLAEETLRRSQALLARTETIAHIGSWDWEAATGTVVWSDELFRIFRRDPAEGAPSFAEQSKLYAPEDLPRLKEAVEVAVSEGLPFELKLRIIRPDGEVRVCLARGHAETGLEKSAPRLFGTFQDITERDHAETALRENAELHRMILRTAIDGFWIVDLAGRLLEVNETYCRMSGYSLPELLAMHISELEAKESAAATAAHLEQLKTQGESRFESRHRRKDGSLFDVAVSAQFQSVDDGRIVAFLQDITARKQSEIAHAHQEAQLRRAEMVAGIGNWEINLATREVAASANARQLYGLGDGAVTLADIQARPLPEYRAKLDAALRDLVESGRPYDVEFQIQRPTDGRLFAIHSIAEYDAAERTVFGVLHDITSHKQVEAALRKSEMRYRTLFEKASDGIVYLSTDLRILEVNESYARMHGYTVAAMKGMKIRELYTPETSLLSEEGPTRLLAGETLNLTAEHIHRDGHVFPVEKSVSLVEIGGEQVIQSFNRDITKRKQLESALENRLVALTRPLDQPEGITFEELFDAAAIQRIQDEFSAATGVASLITRPDGTPLTKPSNFCRLCNDIIRQSPAGLRHCQLSDQLLGAYHADGPTIRPCLSGGLWDAGTSIRVGNRHIANWLIGQVRDEAQSEANMREYARSIGADEETVVSAYREVPTMSLARFTQIAQALCTLANQLSTIAYQNVQQARFIVDRTQAEAALQESEKNYRRLFDGMLDGFALHEIICDAAGRPVDYRFISVNPAFERLTGLRAATTIGRTVLEILPETEPRWIERYGRVALTGEGVQFEEFSGTLQRHFEIAAFRPKPGQFATVFIDITDRKRAEAALRASEQRYRSILRASPDDITITDLEGRILMVSPVALTMFGYERQEDFVGHAVTDFLVPEDREPAAAKFTAMLQNIKPGTSEYRGLRRDGTTFDLEVKAEIIRDLGQPINMIFVARDITARKEVESILRASLLEKEALLKEVHHRVKNNLQVITSLLRLESGRSEQADVKSVLGGMQGRIRSMALLHESLYRSGTFAAVDLGAYLRLIATQCFRTLGTSTVTIQLHVDVVSVQVEMDQAMPCGLLVNELVSNCLKHGFPAGRTGEIRVGLHLVDGGPALCLRVSDTGVGLPADFEAKREKSLGLQLVTDLTRQIDGRLEIGPGPGATFGLIFTPKLPGAGNPSKTPWDKSPATD